MKEKLSFTRLLTSVKRREEDLIMHEYSKALSKLNMQKDEEN